MCYNINLFLFTMCRVLETTSNAPSSVLSKKSKNKYQAEAEKQKAEAEAKAAKDREEVHLHKIYALLLLALYSVSSKNIP